MKNKLLTDDEIKAYKYFLNKARKAEYKGKYDDALSFYQSAKTIVDGSLFNQEDVDNGIERCEAKMREQNNNNEEIM